MNILIRFEIFGNFGNFSHLCSGNHQEIGLSVVTGLPKKVTNGGSGCTTKQGDATW